MQQQNSVGPQGGEVEIVQHNAHVQLAAAGQLLQQSQQVLLIEQVQRRGRFVEKQPALRTIVAPQLRQTARQLHALLFAAGERRIETARQVGTAGFGHHPLDKRWVHFCSPRRAPHGDHRFHRPTGVQLRALQHHRPASGEGGGGPLGKRFAFNVLLAAIGVEKAGKQPQQGRFSRAVGANQRGDFAAPQLQRYVINHLTFAQTQRQRAGRIVFIHGEISPDGK